MTDTAQINWYNISLHTEWSGSNETVLKREFEARNYNDRLRHDALIQRSWFDWTDRETFLERTVPIDLDGTTTQMYSESPLCQNDIKAAFDNVVGGLEKDEYTNRPSSTCVR